MNVVLIDCKYQPDNPHRVFVEMKRRLGAAGVDLTIDHAWSDSYASAQLIIGADPVPDRPCLSGSRILGQRTLNRYQRMEIAARTGASVAAFGSPANDEQLSALASDWGEFCVLKYDWSARRNGVFSWPLGANRKPFPSDFRVGSDLFMQFLGEDPLTYKIDVFCGNILGGWIFPTRSMRLADWQIVDDGSNYDFDIPSALRGSIQAASEELIAHGVGYASFDLMRSEDDFHIIEINTCSVGTTAWNAWPERYGQSYSDAILQTLGRIDSVREYRKLRDQADRAGNEQSSVMLQERELSSEDEKQPRGGARDAPAAATSAELVFYQGFKKSDLLPYGKLVAFWQSTLQDLLVHAHRTVPFYKDRLAPLFGWDGNVVWDQWPSIPQIRSGDIKLERQAMLSRDVPTAHGAMKHVAIAGSDGESVVFSKSTLQVAAESCIEARFYDWHDIDITQAMATLMPNRGGRRPSDENMTWAPEWLPGSHGKDHRGDTDDPPEHQLRWLAQLGPVYLRTRPSIARALAREVATTPALRPDLRGILTGGEILTDEDRALCREYLGHDPVDVYDPSETGMAALQCPVSQTYHVQIETCLVEVLDPQGRPCGPGQRGEIVITPFYNYVMPLIRYATGDFAEMPMQIPTPNQPCACGRLLPTIQRIVSRRHFSN